MVTIDQVKQLETRIAKAIDHINGITGENALLKSRLDSVTSENTLLKTNLDGYQKRIEELEALIQRFKEDQARIEEGIIAALDRLNQFEDDVRKTIESPQAAAQMPADEPADRPLPADTCGEDIPLAEGDTDPADEAEPGSELDIF
ncbi:MAG: cell division protein ZapB [Spirochaetaceae bacterium]|jgi:chromosome segregation ATPase|nr:cell division protein ZapB [Spirochaetaceae bacterium]